MVDKTNFNSEKNIIITWVFFVVVLLTMAALVAIGVTVTTNYTNDTPILLDGGWRVYQGQIPHVDFYSPLGPVMYLLVALGMWLGGLSVAAIVYANLFVFLVVSLWAWFLGKSRFSIFLALVFALYVGFMVVGTNVYSHPFWKLGYAALYNRYGIALLSLILIESFLRVSENKSRLEFWGGVSTGILSALVFFLKINFFVLAILGVVIGWFMVGRSRSGWKGFLIAFFVGALAMLSYLRFDIPDVMRDIYMGIAARSGRAITIDNISTALFGDSDTLLPLVLFVVVFLFWLKLSSRHSKSKSEKNIFIRRWAVFIIFFSFGHIFLSLTNSQGNIPVMFAVGIIIFLEYYRRDYVKASLEKSGRSYPFLIGRAWDAVIICVSAFYVISIVFFPNLLSLAYSAYLAWGGSSSVASEKFSSSSLQDLRVIDDGDKKYEIKYLEGVNDGLGLLRKLAKPNSKIFVLDFTNPFTFGLLWPSPKGDAVWWHEGTTFNKDFYPPPEKVFADVSVVMVPRYPLILENTRALVDLYIKEVEKSFAFLATSSSWYILERIPEGTINDWSYKFRF